MSSAEEQPTGAAIWLVSNLDPDGVYRAVLELDADTAIHLTRELAVLWAEYVLIQVVRAEHDGMIWRQLTATGVTEESRAMLLLDLRKDRAEPESPIRMRIQPGLMKDGTGFLKLLLDGTTISGEWSLDDARRHAAGVIEQVHATDLDQAYRPALIGLVGMDPVAAGRAVMGLISHASTT